MVQKRAEYINLIAFDSARTMPALLPLSRMVPRVEFPNMAIIPRVLARNDMRRGGCKTLSTCEPPRPYSPGVIVAHPGHSTFSGKVLIIEIVFSTIETCCV